MNYNWNWRIYWELSPDGQGTYFHSLLVGLAERVRAASSSPAQTRAVSAICGRRAAMGFSM